MRRTVGLCMTLAMVMLRVCWPDTWVGPARRLLPRARASLAAGRAAMGATARDDGEVVDAVVLSGDNGTSPSESTGLPPPLSAAAEMRAALIQLTSGLDRGSRATQEEAQQVKQLAADLADEAAKAGRWRLSFPDDLGELEGRWRLLYSSAFVGRNVGNVPSLGGLRPGPPLDSPVLEVGDIFQKYRTAESRADTIVQLRPPRWLRETGVLEQLPFVGSEPDTVLTLTQQYDVAAPDTLRFAFVDGQVASKVIEQLKPLNFPLAPLGLPVDTTRDGPFTDTLTTTYSDGTLRIGVGGRFGELRVFMRG